MKKAYDIKISDLKDLLNILRQHCYEPVVQADIYRLSNYIKRYERNFSDQQIPLYERLADDADEVYFYKPFYPYSKVFSKLGRRQNELSFTTSYTPIQISDEQVVDDAVNFFEDKGDFFLSQFQDFCDEADDHLKFIDDKVETAGETLTLKSTGEAFVFVPNYSNITKFTILVHESEHVIDFFNNPNFLDVHVISETAAIFMELLACDYIAKKYSLFDDNFQRRNYLHSIIKSQATILRDKIKLLDLVNKNRELDEETLFKLLNKKGYPVEDIKYFLEATIEQDSAYQLPYLIAVELYIIYHKNKKLALKILEDIIMNADQHNIFDVLRKYGININEHILEYEDMLYKKITL